MRTIKRDFFLIAGIALILIVLVDSFTVQSAHNDHELAFNSPVEKQEVPTMFGIPLPDYRTVTGQIEPGMYLGKLFNLFGVENNELTDILQKTKPVFDVRKMKRGNSYHAFLSNDSSRNLQYLVYEMNPVDYVVFDFKDSAQVYTGRRPVRNIHKEAAGIVNGALWFALRDIGADPLLANELSEVYAWSVDFFALQKGDRFKILYNERTVDGKSIGIGNIEAAYFKHNGAEIYAVPFKQDSTESFYDINGQSLKKAFLKAPLKYSRISSHFSNARRHPILKIVRPHHGVDYGAPMGTPVYALGDGTVIHAAYSGGAGHYVKIRHNSVYTTGYMHLSRYGDGVKPGVRVRQGEVIGYVGSTGLSTGPHLDFRVWKNGKAINPLHVKSPPVEPVKDEYKEEFEKIAAQYKTRLDSVPYTTIADSTEVENADKNLTAQK